MEISHIPSPLWTANGFSEDENEQELSWKQYNAYKKFYEKLLPTVDALMWTVTDSMKNVRQYIFSKDPTGDSVYRVSLFDEKGAVYHVGRDTIESLFSVEQFPYDGSNLTIVRL